MNPYTAEIAKSRSYRGDIFVLATMNQLDMITYLLLNSNARERF